MLKKISIIVVAAVFAITGGAWLTEITLASFDRIGSVAIGNWTAYPFEGTPESDPYAKARLARDANLALGAAEGVTFFAESDAAGDTLVGNCDYRLSGEKLPARFWTLILLESDKHPVKKSRDGLPVSIVSDNVVYGQAHQFEIEISTYARPGNWLAAPADRSFILALNLYDSPIATNKGLVETKLPSISRVRCHG